MAGAKRLLKKILGVCSVLIGLTAIIVFIACGDADWWHYALAAALVLWGCLDLKKDRDDR